MSHKLADKFATVMAKLRAGREVGATGLEYAGMIIVAAFIVTTVYAGISGSGLAGTITNKVSSILSGTPSDGAGTGTGTGTGPQP